MLRPVLLAAVILAAALSGCGGRSGESDGYPAEVVENFMASCESQAVETGGGALTAEQARPLCRCAIDELQTTLPFDEFERYDSALAAGDEDAAPPPEIEDALQKCLREAG